MKTAVEWLLEKLTETHTNDEWKAIIKQAKDMEKEQIVEAHGKQLKKSRGVTNYEYWLSGENYYNETFKP